ncbi:MAG: restriction endonuclease subunit S, partial [Clostridia bacterium]
QLNNDINNNLLEMCNSIYHNYLNKYSDILISKKIVDIAQKVITGKTPSTKNDELWNGDIPFITIPDMHNQVFTINTIRTISKLGAKSIIPKNSISVSCIATVGLVSISTEESQTNQQINSIVLKNNYDLYYLFEFLSEQANYLKSIAGGSTTYNLNKTAFENIEIMYLPENKLLEFHNTVSKMFDKIKVNQIENENLINLRDTLLPKLMNGEIDLDNIEL